MINNPVRMMGTALIAATAMSTSAMAGGLERGGYNIDLLFDTSRFATEAGVIYVMPQRDLENVTDIDSSDGTQTGATSVRDTESYAVPRLGAKAGIGENVDCLVDYSQPFGAHTNPGSNYAGSNSNIETKIDSDGYAATCSYKFQAGKGQLRFIGGISYLEIGGFKERLAGFTVPGPTTFTGVARVDLEGDGVGWRAGVAYEIPEIAFRASLMYYSEVDVDIDGVLDTSALPLVGAVSPIFGNTALPEFVELKVQSGIAPGWLAFGSVKWVDWGQMQSIPLCTVGTASCSSSTQATSLELGYQDGWTVTGGVGHKFNDQISGLVALTWDRGTSTSFGTQSDTWTVSTGASFAANENLGIRLGGALGVLTSGSSADSRITYDYGNDLVAAVSAAAKLKF
ncbi:OmpP1/FadL family transporter [Pseudohoeflea coraliihabitans]|uniref:OmpP1/FadL family transporter n=1 Tax=Pseudohoeflea coraliihabitans TaxID=2860393 RepID=A0ABS6WQ67_9HYPH|nr:OmpP1/FadL family transporter [Pseudohoeflea sp. DP4N28-3]MBW3098109.1 OmpP1/FadL family transporter [Pseudohoeflea sp. DP4N28-3]